MTTTYDPDHPAYLDEADVRNEASRVFDTCHGCRRCVDLCPVFPSLFDIIDANDPAEAGSLTPAEQDALADACFHCTLCVTDCPYAPGIDAREVDVPRLMVRLDAMRQEAGYRSIPDRIADRLAAEAWYVDALAGSGRPSWRTMVRSVLTAWTARAGHPNAGRLTRWLRRRERDLPDDASSSRAVIFPCCSSEHGSNRLGEDAVRLLELGGVGCSSSRSGCCGAPWLHAGDIDRFRAAVSSNVRTLARELAAGGDDAVVVVTEPMCASVIADHYLDHAGPTRRAVAEAVVDRVVDASRFLVELCRDGRLAPGARLDDREVDDALTLHTACHATARDRESAGAVLLRLHGIDVDVVDGCCGAPGTGDHRAGVDRRSERFKLLVARSAAEDGPVASECSLACTTLARAGCRSVGHPISVVAERRGLGPDR